MMALGMTQYYLLMGLSVAALGLEVWALLDCLRRPAEAFVAADKRTKQIWLLVTGVATLLGFLSLGNILALPGLLGVVGAGIYLADVRPAVGRYGGGPSTPKRQDGPYGPW